MHSVIADSAGGAWTFGGSILTFVFPMLLFIVVACALYVAYTKPEVVPGHRRPPAEHPMTYTTVPGRPAAAGREQTGSEKVPGAKVPGPQADGEKAPGAQETEGGA